MSYVSLSGVLTLHVLLLPPKNPDSHTPEDEKNGSKSLVLEFVMHFR